MDNLSMISSVLRSTTTDFWRKEARHTSEWMAVCPSHTQLPRLCSVHLPPNSLCQSKRILMIGLSLSGLVRRFPHQLLTGTITAVLQTRLGHLKWLSDGLPLSPECRDVGHDTQHAAAASDTHTRTHTPLHSQPRLTTKLQTITSLA